jgi:hypothetical protein
MIEHESAKINIAKIGTLALTISYLDGDWKTIQIPSGTYVALPSQNAGLFVSFNDGVEAKSFTLSRGTTYAPYWK